MSSSELTAVRFRLTSLAAVVAAATLTMVTTVSVVSFSFCFMLTAIEGTRRGRVGTGLPRLPAFEEPLASRPLVLVVEMLGDTRLLLALLLLLAVVLFGEECNFPPPDGATFSRWPKLCWWWVSSLTVVPPADEERSFSRAAARSLEDRVVRIGCCGGCCLTCCVALAAVAATCFSPEVATDDLLLLAARLRSRGLRGWCDGDSGSEPPPPPASAVAGRTPWCCRLALVAAALMLEVDVGALRDATVAEEDDSQGRAATAAADRDDVDEDGGGADFEDDG